MRNTPDRSTSRRAFAFVALAAVLIALIVSGARMAAFA